MATPAGFEPAFFG